MKLLRFSPNSDSTEFRLGAMARFDPIIVDLNKEFESYPEERKPKGMSIQGLLTARIPPILGYGILKTIEGSPTGYSVDAIKLTSPVMPSSIRDFYAFEQHVKTANENRGREVPKEWYEIPVFYFTNHTAIFGPGDVIPYPVGSEKLDYELEVAAVIGKAGKDIKPEEAEDYIFGYMIYNDWSARDIQAHEMRVGLGPAKGKDFAQSFGPYLVTPDELADRHIGRPGVYDLQMVARVNGVEMSRGNWKDLHYSFGDMLARASAGVTLYPGDVIGSGTVGTGCLLEITKGQGPYLQAGDVVELEIERLGILGNTVGEKQG